MYSLPCLGGHHAARHRGPGPAGLADHQAPARHTLAHRHRLVSSAELLSAHCASRSQDVMRDILTNMFRLQQSADTETVAPSAARVETGAEVGSSSSEAEEQLQLASSPGAQPSSARAPRGSRGRTRRVPSPRSLRPTPLHRRPCYSKSSE